jgi:cellulose biosynthesis protein BcsQ
LFVLIACWAAKGGSGTTVVAASLAALLARREAGGALVVDLDGGDLATALGLAEPEGPGVGDWLTAGDEVPPDALGRLEVAAPGNLRLLPAGSPGPVAGGRSEVLAALLAADPRPVVVDCGTDPDGPALAVAAAAAHSLLVVRPCYLALRRAVRAPLRPSSVVLVDEPGRCLGARDVEDALGVTVRAVVPCTERIARAVDAGLLVQRLPGSLVRALARVA